MICSGYCGGKMMKKMVVIVLGLCFSCVVFGSPVFAGETKKEDPNKALFEKKCSQCHVASKINEGHRSKADLKKILDRMTSKPACNINAAEAKQIEMYMIGDMGPAAAPGL
jgi:hypothetical protein